MRVRRILTAAAVATTAVLVPLAAPADAAIAVSTLGPTVTITMTGDGSVGFSCLGPFVAVNGAVAQPPTACGTLTQVTVTGDGGDQGVNGSSLDLGSFGADPKLVVSLGAGTDIVFETSAADALDLGADDDYLTLLSTGAANTELDLGGGTGDRVKMFGTSGGETITISSTGANTSLAATTTQGPTNKLVTSVEQVQIEAQGGDDTITAAGVTAPSTLTNLTLYGADGDDTITASSAKGGQAEGGTGTNTFNGGSGDDSYTSLSTTDVIKLGSGENQVYDTTSLRSGGRAISSFGSSDLYYLQADGQDAITRVRPGIQLDTARVTTSLHRTGQQQLGASFDAVSIDFDPGDAEPDRAVADVVALHQAVTILGDTQDDDVLDVTVPSGTWVANINPGVQSTINPDNPNYGTITFNNSGPISVHGPWTDADEGFGHRVIRDLQLRIATAGERNAIRDGLADASTTRSQVVDGLMDTDLYRGLDVDRTFVDFLDRQADPSGRTYWINSLANGKSLVKFRAQLFGSSEYYTKSGGTNASYVRAAYRDVLGRLPDPAGETYWVNKINNGTERGLVAKQFLASTEARRTIVEDQFRRFLDRLPTSGESTTWVGTLGTQPQGEQQLIAFLAASNAYFQRT